MDLINTIKCIRMLSELRDLIITDVVADTKDIDGEVKNKLCTKIDTTLERVIEHNFAVNGSKDVFTLLEMVLEP